MKNMPGTEHISYHEKVGLYQIVKRINGKFVSMGYGKTLIIALMKRDWCQSHNWRPYPRNTKTNEKYIQVKDNHYKVQKRIKGKYRIYGSFETLEEAVKYRDFIVSKGWSTNYQYKNPMRNIYKNNKHSWIVSKMVDGKVTCFGTFKSIEEAQKERDLLEKYDWNLDRLVEHDDGEYSYLDDKKSTRILFKKHEQRRDWY